MSHQTCSLVHLSCRPHQQRNAGLYLSNYSSLADNIPVLYTVVNSLQNSEQGTEQGE